MKQRRLVESFNSAFEGLVYCFKTQRNMKLHFLIAFFVLLLGLLLNLSKQEIVLLSFTIALVLLAEMLNTACELIIDSAKDSFNPLARIIKDVTAGAVLIAALNAVVVGYLIFSGRISIPLETGITKIRQAPWHIAFVSFVSIFFLAILGKVFFKRGTPMRGGMPSVHSAIAFSIWTITAFVTRMGIVTFLVFLMAVMIAQSRILKGIHTVWEVVCGGILGVLITIVLFQIFG